MMQNMLEFTAEIHQYHWNKKHYYLWSEGKQIVLNTGWLCIFSNVYFGSFYTPQKATDCSFKLFSLPV